MTGTKKTEKREPFTDNELFREARWFAISDAIAFANTYKIQVATCVGPPKCSRKHNKLFIECKWCFGIRRCEDRTVEEVDAALQAYTRGH